MKKKILLPCLLLVLVAVISSLLVFGLSAATAITMTEVAEGAVTLEAGDTVTISSVDELKAFSKYVSDGKTTEGITFKLTEDIELTIDLKQYRGQYKTNLNPIGGMYNGEGAMSAPVAFKGTFDGDGFKIINFNLTKAYVTADGAEQNATDPMLVGGGLFELVDGGTVKNLTLSIFQIKHVAYNAYGALVTKAQNGAKILNCHVNGLVTTSLARENNYISVNRDAKAASSLKATQVAGGLVGIAEDAVIDRCSVSLPLLGKEIVGGLVGTAKDTMIRNSMVDGTYTNDKANMILGGIAGELTGTSRVENCFSSAELVGKSSSKQTMGGVVGKVGADATVENCFSEATVRTDKASVIYPGSKFGSLAGVNEGTVKLSYGLRDAAKKNYEAYNDIGENKGTVEGVYAYTVELAGDAASFKVGAVTVTKDVPCSTEVHEDSLCVVGENNTSCKVCGGDGKAVVYTFEPNTEVGSLVDALNEWVASKADSGIDYAAWVVNGTAIVNCTHTVKNVIPYAGQEATCASVGYGDLACASCKHVFEKNVEIPANPENHKVKHTYSCVAYFCTGCNKEIAAINPHLVNADKTCMDQACSRCQTIVEHTTEHIRPEDVPADPEKPCAVYDCAVCGTQTSDAAHATPDGDFYPCQTIRCAVCDFVVQEATASHAPGRSPTCDRAQLCLDCGEVIQAALGHSWGDAATCHSAQYCKVCKKPNLDNNGDGVMDLLDDQNGDNFLDEDDIVLLPHTTEEGATPNCTDSVNCLVCNAVVQKALGHTPNTSTVVDCGHGRSCTVCAAMIQSATSAHTVDWSTATVVRAATATRTGIVEAKCSVCQRTVEAYTTYTVGNAAGTVSISGLNELLFIGSSATLTVKKVADLKNVAVADGYLAVQAAEITVQGTDGNDMAVSGTATVRLALNKSAAKIDISKLKMYQVNGTTVTEVAITAVDAEGYITFTANGAGTFLLAAEKTTAQSVIGVKK